MPTTERTLADLRAAMTPSYRDEQHGIVVNQACALVHDARRELLDVLQAEVDYATAVDYSLDGDGPIAREAKLRVSEAVMVALNKLEVTP